MIKPEYVYEIKIHAKDRKCNAVPNAEDLYVKERIWNTLFSEQSLGPLINRAKCSRCPYYTK